MKMPTNRISKALWAIAAVYLGARITGFIILVWTATTMSTLTGGVGEALQRVLSGASLISQFEGTLFATAELVALAAMVELLDQIRRAVVDARS